MSHVQKDVHYAKKKDNAPNARKDGIKMGKYALRKKDCRNGFLC